MLGICLFSVLVMGVLSLEKYGPNKPHMLFQIGERNKESVSFGWGYYADSGYNHSDMRLKYENTDNGLYCNVLEHDGETHIKQETFDTRHNFDSLIKYQLLGKNSWEAEISMNHSSNGESRIRAFVYMAVQNNDYKTVDHKKTESLRNLVLKKEKQGDRSVEVIYKDHITNVFSVRGEGTPQVFGVNLNISDNWNARNILSHYVGVKEVYRYPEVERVSKKELRDWQDAMVRMMKNDEWYDTKLTFVVLEFEVEREGKIYVKFGEKGSVEREFDHQRFDVKSLELSRLYDNHEKSKFLQHVESNLLSGIAWYYGPLYTQNSLATQEQTFTHSTTPSRLIFPRSFLWDDGFHFMVLVNNYKDKAIRFLDQWLAKIDVFGWIAREQIRGYQVSSMMPEIKFVFQDSFEQNPPTLMLPIQYLIKHDPSNTELKQLLTTNFWKIQKWYTYFKETQSHYDMTDKEEIIHEIKFRWRCKDSCENGNFMGSGLDDFPRQDAGQRSKQHVDLISWLYLFSDSLEKIAQYIDQPKAARFYAEQKQFYNETLFKEYLDKDNLFKDIVVSRSHNINQYVKHIGYISLFPFFTGMIGDNTDQFHATLKVMEDEKILWSQDGIRSLSISDPLYGKGDNYWRGAVWMPINYLILRACKLYYPNTTQQFYQKLRQNIIDTVQRNHRDTGYLFQNYFEGKGNRGFPFYGWTSLVNSIILQVY